jgi:hypothetical protein
MSCYRVTVGKSGTWAHTFGHDPELKGLVPPGKEQPAHLILTLDTLDPRLAPLNVDVGPRLRLVHPYFYSQGGTFSYRHLDQNEITFVPIQRKADPFAKLDPDWPVRDFPRQLPPNTVDIQPLIDEPDDVSIDTIYLGDDLPTLQDYRANSCPACLADELHLIASVPCYPLPDLRIWSDDFVFALFWYCRPCKSIITHNECD